MDAGGDRLHQNFGFGPLFRASYSSPALDTTNLLEEQARQTILAPCKAHNVACGITALTKADVDKKLKEDGR